MKINGIGTLRYLYQYIYSWNISVKSFLFLAYSSTLYNFSLSFSKSLNFHPSQYSRASVGGGQMYFGLQRKEMQFVSGRLVSGHMSGWDLDLLDIMAVWNNLSLFNDIRATTRFYVIALTSAFTFLLWRQLLLLGLCTKLTSNVNNILCKINRSRNLKKKYPLNANYRVVSQVQK